MLPGLQGQAQPPGPCIAHPVTQPDLSSRPHTECLGQGRCVFGQSIDDDFPRNRPRFTEIILGDKGRQHFGLAFL